MVINARNFVLPLVLAMSVLSAHVASGKVDEPVLGTVLPFGGIPPGADNAYVSNVVSTVRDVRARTGVTRFVLGGPGHSVRVSGVLPTEGYRALGRMIRTAQEQVRDEGIEIGYRMGPTVNVGINHPWQKFVTSSGEERLFSACVGDPAYQGAFARQCAAVAGECRPYLHMMEDDFRYFGPGCFCTNHLRRFSAQSGRSWSREELVKALQEPEAVELRQSWQTLQVGDLVMLARCASEAIRAVSPSTRVGLSAPGMLDERATTDIARTLAGPGRRPFVRWWGSIYGTDYPLDVADILFYARWSKENVSDGVECVYEADPCPRNPFYASCARMAGLCSTAYAFGFDGLWYWGVTADGFAGESQYVSEYGRQVKRLETIRACGKEGRLCGISVAMNPAARSLQECGAVPQDRPLDDPAAARLLNRLGIPYTTRQGNVTFYTGHWAFLGMDDAAVRRLLSGRVILDGAAAEELTRRGFAELLGVSAEQRDRVDFTGERRNSDGTDYYCAFHQNYGLDGCKVSRLKASGAEEVSFFYDTKPGRHIQPAVTRFANAVGGRVVVLAVNLAYANTPNLYSAEKRELIVDQIRWLGGEGVLPVRVFREANVMVVANVDAAKSRLFVHALNMSCDVMGSISFEVSSDWRGGRVEVLDDARWRPADVKWEGGVLTVAGVLPVYRTLVFRVMASGGLDAP